MKIHALTQGSDEWLLFRSHHFGASEAAAMLGLSTKVKRTELLHMKHTGSPKEFSDWVQTNILDYGHEVEVPGRAMMEEVIDDVLYPMTCSDGDQSASCDGLTMDYKIAFEHKQWNVLLAGSVEQGIVPDDHMPQCQQVLKVTGAERLYFVVSNGTPEKFVYTEVLPDPEWFERIDAGWEQFAKDLETYEPTTYAERPIADPIKQLPALAIQITGEVVNSNLPMFQAAAERFIETIKTDLKTDEDFAMADANVKFCKTAEERLEAAKDAAIKQTSSIDDLIRTVDFIKDKLRTKRLTLEKLVESQKKTLKENILMKAKSAFAAHVAEIDKEIGPLRLICAEPDFAGAMKAKRTIASLNDAADTALANGKIAANAISTALRAKQKWLSETHPEHGFLFNDLQQIVYKAEDDFRLVVNTRVTDHKATEARKAKEIADQAVRDEQARVDALAVTASPAADPAPQVAVVSQITSSNAGAGGTARGSVFNRIPVATGQQRLIETEVGEGPTDIEIIELIASSYDLTPQEAIARVAKMMLVAARDHFACQAA